MVINILFLILFLIIILPIALFYLGITKRKNYKNMLFLNIFLFFAVLLFTTVLIFSGNVIAGENIIDKVIGDKSFAEGMGYLSAAIATGLCTLGTGIATGQAASAALGTLSENEKLMGKALIFVALAEGTAVYGLIVSFTILGKI